MTHQPNAQIVLDEPKITQKENFALTIKALLEGFTSRNEVEVWIDGEPPMEHLYA